MRGYPEECGKQWRPVQKKSGWEKQKEKEEKEEVGKKRRKKYERKERKRRRRRKTKERKDDGGEESSKRVGDLGGRGRDSKIWDGNKKVGARKVSQMDKNTWEKTI